MKESEETVEAKESELVQYRAQIEANEIELNQYKLEINNLETEKEVLQNEINALKTIQSQSAHFTLSSEIELDVSIKEKPQLKKSNSVKSAPRLFCDICDEFDLHDTNDCPQQYSNLVEQKIEHETHTKYNASSASNSHNRAYCDLCEQFGHDESECPMQNNQNKTNASDEEF